MYHLPAKKAIAIASALRDSSRCFSSTIWSSLSLLQFRREHSQVCIEQNLGDTEKMLLMHHALENPGREFFYTRINGLARNLDQAFEILVSIRQ